MSGQQIGSFVGGVIGAYFGGPFGYAIGSAIGGAIGGYIDPTIIKGPRLSDATAQTAQDGIPIPFGFGTFPTSGNIIFASPLREKKKEDDGKGTGIVNVTYHYYRSYAIGICQGVRQDDGTYLPITGILQVKRNGKIVYNVAPGATSAEQAGNSKFLRRASFYLGGEDQLPSAMMEGFKGAGNVPAYRGLAFMEVGDEELTDLGGAIPQYEFVVVVEGDVTPYHLETLEAGHQSRFQNGEYPLAEDGDHYDYEAYWIYPGGGGITSGPMESIQECIDWVAGICIQGAPSVYLGYGSNSDGNAGQYTNGTDGGVNFYTTSEATTQLDVEMNEAVTLFYQWEVPTRGFFNTAPASFCPDADPTEWTGTYNGEVLKEFPGSIPGSPQYLILDNCGSSYVAGFYPLCIRVISKRVGPASQAPPGAVQMPDDPDYWLLPTGEIVFVPTYEEVSGAYKVLSKTSAATSDALRDVFSYFEVGPALASTDPNYNNQSFWEAQYDNRVLLGDLPAGWTYGLQYPDIVTSVWKSAEVDSEIIDRHLIPLAQIVAAICRRAGLVAADYDVASLTDLVDGFKIATEGSGESYISPLMQGFFFDAGEWDDKIRFVKRGGDVVDELGPADMCEIDGQPINETELQEVELLRKVNVKAIDPAAGFNVTTQTWERRTSTVAAKGEQTTEIPVVIDHDTQARMAAKKGKVAWSEVRRFEFCIPYTHPGLTVTDLVGLTDSKGRRQRIRLMEMGQDSGQIQIKEAMLDRQSSYTSNVQGVVHNPPTDTGTPLIGATFFVAMNLNSLRSSDNVPGMYIAGTGVLPGWSGYLLQMSVDGGTTFQTVLDAVTGADMGALTGDISDTGSNAEPVPVFMYAGQLHSIELTQIADRFNAFAITTNGVSEVGQFVNEFQDSAEIYHLTSVYRGLNGTVPADHFADDIFVMLSTVTFLPIDASYAGRTLLFRPVSFGTVPENNPIYSFVFDPPTFVIDGGEIT